MAEDVKGAAEQTQKWLAGTEQIQAVLQQIAAIQEQIAGSQGTGAQAAQQLQATLQQQIQSATQLAEVEGRITDAEQRRQSILQQQRTVLQQLVRDLTLSSKQRERALIQETSQLGTLEEKLDKLKSKANTSSEAINAQMEKITEKQNRINQLNATNLEGREQERSAIIRSVVAQERLMGAQKQTSKAMEDTIRILLAMDSRWRGTLSGAVGAELVQIMQAKDKMGALRSSAESLAASLSNVASASNVVGSTIMQIQESTIKMVHTINTSEIAFRKSSGASKEFARGLSTAWDDSEIKRMAGSYSELAQVQSSLYSNFRAFSSLTVQQRTDLSRLGIAAQRAGIGFDDFSTVVEKSTRIFGQRSTEAMRQLISSAHAIGEVPARVVKNYINSLDTLAQYSGPRAIKVFQQLSAVSKQTGVDMNRLIGIASQFDTFEGAAGSVAKLNAILGGPYLNSIQMLNAEEGQRLSLLRGALDATNRTWASLGRFEKKAVAAAAGFKDLSIAAAFFTGNMSKVREMTQAQERQVETTQQLWQAASSLTGIMQKYNRVIDGFGRFAQQALPYAEKFMDILNKMGPVGFMAGKAILSLGANLASYALQARMAASAQASVAAGSAAMGRGMMAVLGPIGLLVGGLALLHTVFIKESSPSLVQAVGMTAGGFNNMATTAANATPEIHRLAGSLSTLRPTFEGLNEKKVAAFGNAVGQLGFSLKNLPKENIVAVTNVIRESREAGGMAPAAASRNVAAFAAQGRAVQAARQASPPPGGSQGGQERQGVLVTDSIVIDVGSSRITESVKDVMRSTYERQRRNLKA